VLGLLIASLSVAVEAVALVGAAEAGQVAILNLCNFT
jgi:hypothetical protein